MSSQRYNSKPPTVAELENGEGWIETTDPFLIGRELTFTEEARQLALKPCK